MPTRESLRSVAGRLDADLYPMRLFQKAKRLGVWDPCAVDLSRDRADWAGLADDERDLLLRLTAQFQAGEESVTYDLLPLLAVAADAGRIEEEMFLTSYLWEEAKHVEAFDRFLSEVAGEAGDLDRFLTAPYKQIFYEEQPRALARLHQDRSPEALAEASVVYQMITEGVLAETGYYAYFTVLERNGILPGMQELVASIQRDESRHLGYGVFLLSRLIVEHGEPIWQRIETTMDRLLVLALQNVAETLAPYGDDIPFGVTVNEFAAYASSQADRRLSRIERARQQTLEQVLYGRDEAEDDGARRMSADPP